MSTTSAPAPWSSRHEAAHERATGESEPAARPTVEIDGVELAAPKGSMIIHAADKAGIPIPRFCYHEKLPIAANCRMCLVEVEKSAGVPRRSRRRPAPRR
jgi:ferredoxin